MRHILDARPLLLFTTAALSLSGSACSAEETANAELLTCLLEQVEFQSPEGAQRFIVNTDTDGPCRKTAEAYRYYQMCEVAMTMHASSNCAKLHNPDVNRIPSTLRDAASSREALEYAYRRDCGDDPIPTPTLLAYIEKCSP